jgi:hypothetical protein
MAIQDLAGNPIPGGGVTGQTLGYIEPPEPEEILPLDMYEFLIEPIRIADRLEGELFVKRLFTGPQAAWEQTHTSIFHLKTLWSVTEIADKFLPYLKNIVGWTKELDYITNALDSRTLRRLIAASVPLWKERGPEDTLINVMRLITGSRLRLWNWFDFRFVMDETALGHEQEGRDPWLIELPGAPSYDERRMNLRIVDDLNNPLDRDLVKNIVNLMRPISERIEVSYLTFLDLFNVAGDNFQWTMDAGGTDVDILVEDGNLKLLDNTQEQRVVVTGVEGADDWADYVVGLRMKQTGGHAGLLFYFADSNNYYRVTINPATGSFGRLRLTKVVAGVATGITTYNFTAVEQIFESVFYMIRVEVIPDGAANRIRVFIDGDMKINTTDNAHSKGKVGIMHVSGATVEASEVELWLNPLETETVDINFGS